MDGRQLNEGWNDVIYEGPTQSVEDAIASIRPYVRRIWVRRNDTWYMYDPYDSIGTDLYTLKSGEKVHILVTEDCFWEWEYVGPPLPPPDIPPFARLMTTLTPIEPPAEVAPRKYVINQTVAIYNDGGPGKCRIYVRDMSPNTSFTFASADLRAGEYWHPRLAVFMPDAETFTFRVTGESYKDGRWVIDTQTELLTVERAVEVPFELPGWVLPVGIGAVAIGAGVLIARRPR